ncbi:hypothetical protein [Undibacterium sp. TC9W]|uniref:hypothetical protein n=1 Tax=Undibacterium sp. TC9W TaxID=3413053 RepID=UPI003BF2D2B4
MQRLKHFLAFFGLFGLAVSAFSANDTLSPFAVVNVDIGSGEVHYVTIVPQKIIFSTGLIPQAIVGQLLQPNGKIAPENFARNSVFVEYMHDFIRREGAKLPQIKSQAEKIKNGKFDLMDLRPGPPSSENIIGVFNVQNGKIISYERNRDHRILSNNGFFRLPYGIEMKLIEELSAEAKRNVPQAKKVG